jgi:hypothetical protein
MVRAIFTPWNTIHKSAFIHPSTLIHWAYIYEAMALLKRADVGAFLDLIHSGPGPLMVIFFVAPSVDALGTLKILTVLT